MSMTSRDVLFMMRARDYASREVRNLGGAFGALGKAIQKVDTNLKDNLNRSMERQGRMIQQNKDAATAYARVIDQKVVASQKRQADAVFQARRAMERDTAAHKSNISSLEARNKHLAAQNALIRASRDPQKAATDQARAYYNEARKITRDNPLATKSQIARTNALRSTHEQLQRGTLTYQKYISQRGAEAALNREQIGTLREQIRTREAAGRAQIRQIDTVAKREQDMLRESARRYGEASTTHQRRLRETGEAERKAFEQEAQRQRQALQLYQRKIMMLQAVGIAATITGATLLALGNRGVKALRGMAKESMEFRHGMALAMTQIQNDTPATIEGLVQIGRVVGNEIPAAMDTMGSTMFFIFSSLQADIPAAQKLLEGFAREAVAGNTDIESAARSTIAILNGMGLEFKDLNRVQDFQFQTVRRGVITYEQLSQNIGKLIPALARSGQEIETGGAMLAFLTRQGLSAEMATTAAARSLELLAHPRVINRLEDMGIAIRDSRGEFLPLIDILSGMNEQIGHLSAPGRVQAMWEMFSGAGYRIQARRFFDTVFNNFERFEWHIDQQLNNAGAMRRAYEIMFAEPVNQIQLFQNNLTTLRQEMGDRLIPIYMKLIEVGQSLIDWFRGLDAGTKDAIVRFAALASGAALLTGGILLVVGVFITLVAILSQVTASITLAFGIVAGGPAIIMSLIGALFALALHWEAVIDVLDSSEVKLYGTLAAIAALATAIHALGGFGNIFAAISLGAEAARISIAGAGKALWAFALTPLGAILTVIAGIAAAVYLLNTRAKENKKFVEEMVDAQAAYNDEIDSSIEAFDNYATNVGKARREIMRTRIAQEGLTDTIHLAGLSQKEFLDITASSVREQEYFIRRTQRRMTALQETEANRRTEAQRDEINALLRVRNEMRLNLEATRENIRLAQAELRARGGLGEIMADYVGIVDLNNDAARVQEARMRETIRAAIELQAEMGILDEDMLSLAESLGIVDEETGEFIASIQELSQVAENFGQVAGNLTDASNAWSEALNKANEGLEEPLDSLLDFSNGMDLWIESLNEGKQSTESMFGNMATIIANNSDIMKEDVNLVIGAVLAMGDAGPEAMEMLATADPDQFLEVLRVIRLNAALTSDAVKEHTDEMLDAMHSIIETRGPEVVGSMELVLEAVALTVAQYGELSTGHIETMMDAILVYVENGGELTLDEMRSVMSGIVLYASEYGGLTAAEIENMMELLNAYVESGGDIMGEDFAGALAVLAEIAKSDGPIVISELADALGVAPEMIRTIAQQTGTAFTEGVDRGMNPRQNVEYYRRNFERQQHLLNSMGYNTGVSINAAVQRGLTARGLSLPSIRYQVPQVNTGPWRGVNTGGLIPGRGPNRDSVPAMLTRGEYVLRRSAVDALGVDTLDALNKFNSGGPVGMNTGGLTTSIMRNASEGNLTAARDMMSAFSAMQSYENAQRTLSEARAEVNRLRSSLKALETESRNAARALELAWTEARKITAAEELTIIAAQRTLRSAQAAYDAFGNGLYALNQELDELRQVQRVEQLKKSLEDIANADYGNLAELEMAASEAQSRYLLAKANMQQTENLLPAVQDEVQALLLQYKAENELNDAMRDKAETSKALEDAQSTLTENSHNLRIAEIELKIAEEELGQVRQQRSFTDEYYREAQLNLQLAQEALTQAHRDAVGPTDEVREAQERVRLANEQSAGMADQLAMAQRALRDAELGVINSTLGLIDAGQKLVGTTTAQTRFFRSIATSAGVSKSSVDALIKSMQQLQTVSKSSPTTTTKTTTTTTTTAPKTTTTTTAPKTTTSSRTYTVKSGDSLWAIASRLYGSGFEWRKLYDLNRSVIGSNPDLIFPGQVLKYDNGGILRPGWTMAYNGTGQNEFITRQNSVGSSLTIERGAINVRVDGDATEVTQKQIEEAIEKLLEDLYDQMRSE